MPPLGHALPDGWRGAFLASLGQGQTIAQASTACGVSIPHLYRLRAQDETFRIEWDAAKRIWREMRKDLLEERRAWVEDALHTIAADPDDKRQFAALLKLYDGTQREAQRLEITGPEGGPVTFRHEGGLTLAAVLAAARSLEGPGGSTGGSLPPARPLLPAPADG